MAESNLSKNDLIKAPEIVAPAGNLGSFYAAISAGADAIYLGVKEFNARRRADNFEISEIPDLVKEAHLRNCKVYATLNILLKNDELIAAFKVAENLLEAGCDAFVVQDLGFARMLLKSFPGVKIHASTQINAHNLQTIRVLKKIGFERVVLSRELNLDEIEFIAKLSELEIEVFIHGALCFSYSGQCLLSSIVGGRSGNRGLCAQPCRLPYALISKNSREKRKFDLPVKYLLSTKDLLGIYHLYDLIKAGVSAFKIEGRLKSPEYVQLVTEVYARELRRALTLKENYSPLSESIEALEEAFSRGFSPAYFDGIRGNEMMSYSRPNNRGVFIGRVVYVDKIKGRVGIALKKDLNIGDVLEFWTKRKGRVTQVINKLYDENSEVENVKANSRAHVIVEKDRHLIRPGDRVYRVINAKLISEARKKMRNLNKTTVPVTMHLNIDEKGNAIIVAESEGSRIELKDSVKVEPAQKSETTDSIVKNLISKLGGTPYTLQDAVINLPKNVHIRAKEINRLRRRTVELLNEERLKKWRKTVEKALGEEFWKERLEKIVEKERITPIFAVKVADKKYFDLAVKANADIVFVRFPFFNRSGFSSLEDLNKCADKAEISGSYLGLAFPEVIKDGEFNYYLDILNNLKPLIKYVISDNLGFLKAASELGFRVFADYHLNVTNSLAANELANLGAAFETVSVELNFHEIIKTIRPTKINWGVLIAGDLELMVSEHCPLTSLSFSESFKDFAEKETTICPIGKKEGSKIPRFCEISEYWLLDRVGFEFPIRTDLNCRGYIYNSKFFCAIEYLEKLFNSGIALFRVDILSKQLNDKELFKFLKSVRNAINRLKSGNKIKEVSISCPEKFTRGHFERGVF